MKKGILLINLGTPRYASLLSVFLYLTSFLTDKRVISLPFLLRYLLVYGLIVPLRLAKSTHAYKSIWQSSGSPLRHYSINLKDKLQNKLGSEYLVAFGMRYGPPGISEALQLLKNCDELTVLPLYPQYASSSTGSSIEKVLQIVASYPVFPNIKILRDFYQHPAFIKASAIHIKQHLPKKTLLLFSYHGLPENRLKEQGCNKPCRTNCDIKAKLKTHARCYRLQCIHTSELIAAELKLKSELYASSFQSRLGRESWIHPYTEDYLQKLRAEGIENLAVYCPSFVSDCLETLEEIAIRAKEVWHDLGGKNFSFIPSFNDSEVFLNAVTEIVNK
jgi:protoporphyrin/coproporphyrin ferrochelatase